MADKQAEALEGGPLQVDDAPKAQEPGEDDAAQQARALAHYRVSGQNSLGYRDQSRDQEPDIGAEFGQAPHPELFNPKPHEDAALLGSRQMSAPGIGESSDDPRVVGLSDEEQKEAQKAAEENAKAAQKRDKERAEADPAVVVAAGPAQPVVVVDDQSKDSK